MDKNDQEKENSAPSIDLSDFAQSVMKETSTNIGSLDFDLSEVERQIQNAMNSSGNQKDDKTKNNQGSEQQKNDQPKNPNEHNSDLDKDSDSAEV